MWDFTLMWLGVKLCLIFAIALGVRAFNFLCFVYSPLMSFPKTPLKLQSSFHSPSTVIHFYHIKGL